MGFLEQLGDRASRAGRRIVLVEGHDERVQEAARRIRQSGHLDLTLLIHEWGNAPQDAGDVRCPEDDPELVRYLDSYGELLASEASEPEAARQLLCDPLYFAGMMVRAGDADGAVAGAVNSTGSVVRAALRCIGTAAGSRLVSGAFYMVVPPFRGTPEPEVLTFADPGVVPDPDVEQLVEVAAQAASMRRKIVGDEPRVAFLSYSTRGSAAGPSVEKMQRALARFREVSPDVQADGEFQADAALIDAVGRRKAPDSPVAGRANVLIFPDLNAGNIAYKLVERLAGATAIGPILHGLERPFNDLSRGADAESIEWAAYVTALMASGA